MVKVMIRITRDHAHEPVHDAGGCRGCSRRRRRRRESGDGYEEVHMSRSCGSGSGSGSGQTGLELAAFMSTTTTKVGEKSLPFSIRISYPSSSSARQKQNPLRFQADCCFGCAGDVGQVEGSFGSGSGVDGVGVGVLVGVLRMRRKRERECMSLQLYEKKDCLSLP